MIDGVSNLLWEAISKGAASDAESFVESILRNALGWPISRELPFEEIPYEWKPEEIGLDRVASGELAAAVRQVPPLVAGQPWGVFIVEMREGELFRHERGLAGILRRMLAGLIEKKGRKTDSPAWKREELLFILTHEYRDFRFAYFRNPPVGKKSAPLAAFGWLRGDTHIRTLCEMNLPALHWPANPGNREEWVGKWAEAFDVAKVTRQFYRDYEKTFSDLEADINGVSGAGQKRLYAQRLMNRLMFVYFIQRKGWLTFAGGTDYLRRLYDDSKKAGDDFLNDRLYELFFSGFNLNPESLDAKEKKRLDGIIGRVPYLNGGLFAHAGDGTDAKGKARISRKSFEKILGLFEAYNFTISESTPLEIEVAVDPEMLGKVFEELVTGRHETGSYYTPRPVVSFMCRESLKAYLERAGGLAPEAAAGLVDEGDASGLTQTAARTTLEALDGLKAVDPACGSGAYLLGLLHEITAIHKALFSEKLRRDSRSLYQSKLRIISGSLYGVDNDAFAVEIARLRLWLSLAVDSDEPEPLPNLDFKIEAGDSLLSPDPGDTGNAADMYRSKRIPQLEKLKKRFFSEMDETKKRRLHDGIDDLRGELRRAWHSAGFDWRVEFGEAFARPAGGFDLVLANPPYVRHELLDERTKEKLRDFYGRSVYAGTADLYCYFYARGVELLRPGGVLAFISSNKWFKAGYGKKLRGWLGEKCSIRSVVDFGDLPVFENTAAYPMIFVAGKKGAKTAASPATLYAEPKSLDPPYPDLKAVVAEYGAYLPAGSLAGEGWRFADAASQERFETMRKRGVPLGEYVEGKIFYGIKTGYNKAFVIDGETRE
ncbi:MAG: Eco57I restriction-modification methylase domain-containing protein, partial [Planctomycetota bacterium]|nr:Eco57I restriction-modification methylase domain-containing protein [Planctomycetota bacterium]